ncbi:MAG: hypothetical protein Sw2LagTSB_16440 [Shewanella algae]
MHKASELLLHEFRSGKIGQLSLETPEMAQAEEVEVAKLLAEKEAMKQAKKEADKLKRAGKRHQG